VALTGDGEGRVALAGERRRGRPRGAPHRQPVEALSSGDPGEVEGLPAVDVQHVEGEVGHGHGLRLAGGDVRVGDVHPLLEALEAGHPPLVEGDHLAVKDHRIRPEGGPEGDQLGVGDGHVPEGAGLQAQGGAVPVGHGSDAVPLQLEGEVVVVAGERSGGGEHGTDVSRRGRHDR
jgi:hypothetical protein